MIPQVILGLAQQKLLQATTDAIMQGRKTSLLSSFVLGDDVQGRYYFSDGHKPAGTKPPNWFRYFEGIQVWKAGEKIDEWLDYTVFKLVKAKVKVTYDPDDGVFWLDGLDKERCHMRTYSTLAGKSFWECRHDLGYSVEYLTRWLLAN